MVKKMNSPEAVYYVCPECHLAYREESWARACQEFCSQHHACSLEITRHAVEIHRGGTPKHVTLPQ